MMYFISQKRYNDKQINGIYFVKSKRFFVYQTEVAPKGEKLIDIYEVMKQMQKHYLEYSQLNIETTPTNSAYYNAGCEYINGFDELVIILKNYFNKVTLLKSDFTTFEMPKKQFTDFYRPTGRFNKALTEIFNKLNFERIHIDE